jgi:hypothetical protein
MPSPNTMIYFVECGKILKYKDMCKKEDSFNPMWTNAKSKHKDMLSRERVGKNIEIQRYMCKKRTTSIQCGQMQHLCFRKHPLAYRIFLE